MKFNLPAKRNLASRVLRCSFHFKAMFFIFFALSALLEAPATATLQELNSEKAKSAQSQNAAAQSQNATGALYSLATRAKGITFIKSSFRQTKYLSFMDEKVDSEGFFTFTAPQELLWQYTSPVSTGFSYKNGKASMWASEKLAAGNSSTPMGGGRGAAKPSKAEQAIAKAVASHILPWVSFDVKLILKTYNVQLLKDKPLMLKLTPKELATGSPIRFFEVTFASNNVDVQKIVFYEQDEDVTQIDFYNSEHH